MCICVHVCVYLVHLLIRDVSVCTDRLHDSSESHVKAKFHVSSPTGASPSFKYIQVEVRDVQVRSPSASPSFKYIQVEDRDVQVRSPGAVQA